MSEHPAGTVAIAGHTGRWRAAAVVWMTVIAAASLVPGEVIATVPGTASLAGHAVAYAVLAYVLTRLGWPVWRAGLGAWCYGALIEVLAAVFAGPVSGSSRFRRERNRRVGCHVDRLDTGPGARSSGQVAYIISPRTQAGGDQGDTWR